MTKALLFNKMMPADNVTFDFNPESLTVKRSAKQSTGASGGAGGATASQFKGSPPCSLSGKAYLEGDDVKDRAEMLLTWCEPGGGMLAKAAGAALGALTAGRINLATKQPTLIFKWGPFLMECLLNTVTINYERFDKEGAPTRGLVDFLLFEQPSLLSMLPTNPTSGGLPGRKRHVVSHGESLALIAAQTYGHPGLWRAVADANGIDDPFRIPPGRVLLLPSVSELSSTAGG